MESIRRITPPDFPETLEELQQMSRALQSRIQHAKETALQFSRDAEQAERVLDEMRDDEEALQDLDAKITSDTRRYDLLLKAQAGLRTAKLSLSRKYANPVTEHFRKYLGMILSEGQEDFRVDPEGKVLVEDHNEPRSLNALSHGFKDLSYFCMRVALVDSMYEKECPPIMLDDPFVNLDDTHAARAVKVVQEIAKERQVLYFTCSEGRMAKE
jgi:DNA repair exonuclease SbcCD ATPase subunit